MILNFLAGDLHDQGQLATYIQDMRHIRMFRKSKIMDSSINGTIHDICLRIFLYFSLFRVFTMLRIKAK